jgi:CheY-like chemotaxis protein
MNSGSLKIVLADDDENDRSIFREALDEININTSVHTVNDGVELMDYLQNVDQPLPDLLFLDLNMPRKNGIQCLKEIRGTERLNGIAIAIYSTSAADKDVNDTFDGGANVYIKKPNDFTLLKKVLNQVAVTASVYRNPPFNIGNFILKL